MSSSPSTEVTRADPEHVAELRRRLDKARASFGEDHLKRTSLEVVRSYSAAIDELLTYHLDHMAEALELADLPEQLAVVALGGYGRSDLSLHSDIDFCFLFQSTPTPEQEETLKAIIYPLWDLKIDLGYAVHSVGDCLAALGQDIEKTTALIEARHLWGNDALTEQLNERTHSKLRSQHVTWFMRQLGQELDKRHDRFGDTVFLLEPDIKHSCGGLRDIHHLLWMAFAHFGQSNLGVLSEHGMMTGNEQRRLVRALGFLLELRNTLHLSTDRRIDLLTLERQVEVAAEWKIRKGEVSLPEEQLMRQFYDHAQIVDRLSRRIFQQLSKLTPGLLDRLGHREPPRRVDRDFWAKGDTIWVEPDELPAVSRERSWMIRYFNAAARERLEPTEETLRAIEERLDQVDDEFRASAFNREQFLSILKAGGTVAPILRAMNRCRFLSTYIPEFRKVLNLPRIDHYHRFTVDEHMIRSVQVAESLLREEPPPGLTHCSEVAKELLRVDLLNFALLFHDIGKGEGNAHVIRGMHIVQRITERMSMTKKEQEVVRQLIANHQKMSHMATRRDIEDPTLAKELAEAVQEDPEQLRMLYVHTVCDVRAVSKDSWNEWRGRLLALLFEKTMDELRGNRAERQSRIASGNMIDKIADELRQREPDAHPREISRFVFDMPERYLRTARTVDVVTHFLLAREVTEENRVRYRFEQFSNYVELTFVARDAPSLFSSLCSALASKNFDILSAQIYTAKSGEVVDIFQVRVPDQLANDLPRLLDRICGKLNKLVRTGERQKWGETVSNSKTLVTKDRLELRPPRVDINNEMSPTHTVVEVRAPDCPGLLSALMRVFDEHKLNVDLAFIATESYQVVDVFYVTDFETNKLPQGVQTDQICKQIMQAIQDLSDAEVEQT